MILCDILVHYRGIVKPHLVYHFLYLLPYFVVCKYYYYS